MLRHLLWYGTRTVLNRRKVNKGVNETDWNKGENKVNKQWTNEGSNTHVLDHRFLLVLLFSDTPITFLSLPFLTFVWYNSCSQFCLTYTSLYPKTSLEVKIVHSKFVKHFSSLCLYYRIISLAVVKGLKIILQFV